MTAVIGFVAEMLGAKYARFAKPLVFLGLAALIGLALWGAKCAYDAHIIKTHDTEQENKTLKRVSGANDQAADERAADTIALEHKEQEAHDAIHQGPDAAPSPAAVRHNCERLRRSGYDTTRLPACSGHQAGG